ncbi:ComF family protein [Flavobacterium sp. JP2137]|uniref:ComF family protein n=1 Tax=Flavobacterium sp. JP2137 TaxID=3414510 RepID=UPI003D2FC6F3
MIFKSLFNLCFPRQCFGCNQVLLRHQTFLCAYCLHHLPFTEQHRFRENEAYQRFHGRLPLENCSCLIYFTKSGFVQRLFHELKYNNQPEISHYLGKIYASQLQNTAWLQTVDALIPVPMHATKRKKRGYNQVDGFAQALSETFGIPIAQQLLTQEKPSSSQTRKSLFERTRENKFRFQIAFQPQDHGKHYVLLDDILTTGGTLEACGKKILEIPDCKISILCLAQTQ